MYIWICISSILLLIAIATTCHGQYDDYDISMFDTNIAEYTVSHYAGRMTGEIYQGEGCVVQEMETEESGVRSAGMENVM